MATIYTYGEVLAEIMRLQPDVPLNQIAPFNGPYPSGAPAIFIDTAARLGHKTKIWAGIGNDKFGDCIIERLQKDGVDCKHLIRNDKTTAVAFVSYDSAGDREFIFHMGNTAADNFDFEADEIVPDCFHVMGCSVMASESFKKGIEKAVTHYSALGSNISFDPNLRPELLKGRSFKEIAGKIMGKCTIFLPGVNELMLAAYDKISNIPEKEYDTTEIKKAADKLFKEYTDMEIINVKLGSKGSVIFDSKGQQVFIPVYDITSKEPLVDATGAGDTFDATFVGAILEKKSLKEAGFLASKAGALNIISLGGMETELSRMNEKILPIDDEFIL